MASTDLSSDEKPCADIIERILATVYGQCIGDAIGLLTEFLTRRECKLYYKSVKKELEYFHKAIVCDGHRNRWKEGDWTDDTDQMILIMRSLVDTKGKADCRDFGSKLLNWVTNGFSELGDVGGLGLGKTTQTVLKNPEYLNDPHAAAEFVWTSSQRNIAPNGAVMRTAFVGIHMYQDLHAVKNNAIEFAKATHYDPRCQASAVAVSVAIATMLQGNHKDKKGNYKVNDIIKEAFKYASECLETEEQKEELMFHLSCKNIKKLKLDEERKIGYTYKSMGSGFWALKEDDFRKTITKIIMQGGDADSNACVAGAMMGCKLGLSALPEQWLSKLLHKEWLNKEIKKYFMMMNWDVHHVALE